MKSTLHFCVFTLLAAISIAEDSQISAPAAPVGLVVDLYNDPDCRGPANQKWYGAGYCFSTLGYTGMHVYGSPDAYR